MAGLMSGEISKTLNRLLTATMLVVVLIACERMPKNQTQNQPLEIKPSYNLTNNFR